ncbi:MAG: hypothetical protein ACREGA_01950 [Candidatus Saccharimonadales bacterium]
MFDDQTMVPASRLKNRGQTSVNKRLVALLAVLDIVIFAAAILAFLGSPEF